MNLSEFNERYEIDRKSRGLRAIEKKVNLAKPKRARKLMTDEFVIEPDYISLTIGMETISEANKRGSEHWRETHKRKKAQKEILKNIWQVVKRKITLPCVVRFTRFAPKLLDTGDNDRLWAKTIRDVLCNELIGVDDKSSVYTFEYRQYQSKQYGVKIEIWDK